MAIQQQKIIPYLWFDGTAEDAVNFYVSIFKNSTIDRILRRGDAGPGPKGSVLTIGFVIDGLALTALNGGPQFKFTEAVSFAVECDTQDEIDYYWSRLTDGGAPNCCGWLKDKFGLSWQVYPRVLIDMIADNDGARADRAMRAMMQMVKFDLVALQAAYDGKA